MPTALPLQGQPGDHSRKVFSGHGYSPCADIGNQE